MDIVSKQIRSRMMSAVRGKNTKPEMMVRRLVHKLGYRFRIHRRDLPGCPDIVFPGRKAVIFVHGCFWHQHPGCKKAVIPRSNANFWMDKFSDNVRRDVENVRRLGGLGWRIMIVWECEVGDLENLATRLVEFLDDGGAKSQV